MFLNSNRVATFILLTCISLILLLQLHNLSLFAFSRGFDAGGHIEYINFLKQNMRVPLAYEGWELYQPPLYYFLVAFVSSPIGIKIFSFLMWLLLTITSYKFFQKKFNDINISFIGTFITSSLPAVLYLTYTISNEFFSGVLISIALVYYVSFYKPTNNSKIILGILIGLSFLAKATAFVLVLSIAIDRFILARYQIIKTAKNLFLPFGISFLMSGWFYLRNWILFGGPFISSYNFPKIYPLMQTIVPRNLAFFLSLKGFLTMDLFRSHHYSFLSGTFFSWFYDGHNIIIPVQEFSKIGVILVLFSLPIFIFFLIGYAKEYLAKKNKNVIFLLYSTLLFIGYIAYNFRLPYYSTVKSVFLISVIIPFGYFFIKGIMPYKKYLFYISLYIAFYTIILIRNFWILKFWYIGT